MFRLLALLILLPVLALAETGDEPFGAQRLLQLFEVLASEDATADSVAAETLFAAEFLEHYGVDGTLDLFRQLREELGEFEVQSLDGDGPLRAVALVEDGAGVVNRFTVETEPSHPYALMGFQVKPYDPEAELGEIPAFESLREMDAFLTEAAERGAFSGVVLIETPVDHFEHAYGLANREAGWPNTEETRFNLGSITKLFTRLAILQLAEAGRLSLNDTLDAFIDEIPDAIAERVTVQQLLDHTSGYGDYTMARGYRSRQGALHTIRDHLPFIAEQGLEFEPGTETRYSNTGYLLLGAIIEVVSESSYPDYVADHIFDPAGMEQSSFPDSRRLGQLDAIGYTEMNAEDDGDRGPNTSTMRARGQSDGGSYSSAADLLRFEHALRDGALLSEAGSDALIGNRNGGLTCLAGGAEGVSATMCRDLGRGVTIIVLTNLDEPVSEDVAEALTRIP